MREMLVLIQVDWASLVKFLMQFVDLIAKHPSAWMTQHLQHCFPALSQDELSIQTQEFLKFIYIQSMNDGGFIPVSDEIDQIWHEYILQTREYQILCMDLPGKAFIHHQTTTLAEYVNKYDRKDVIKKMLDWIPDYFRYFGEFTEKTAPYWTMVTFLSKELHLSLQQINEIGKSRPASE